MQISVSGKHIDIGGSLSNYIEIELENSIKKYFEQGVGASVILTKERHLFYASVIVNEGTSTHQLVKADGEAGDAYSAFDQALIKIKKQLRRYKRKIKNHHKLRVDKKDAVSASKVSDNLKLAFSKNIDASLESNADPLIIVESPECIETLSVSDAVLRMDLGKLPVIMFINKKTGETNILYRREDGNISWVDPSSSGYKKQKIA